MCKPPAPHLQPQSRIGKCGRNEQRREVSEGRPRGGREHWTVRPGTVQCPTTWMRQGLQAPFTQVPSQTIPQSPQLASSILTLTQAPAAPLAAVHILKPPGHAHSLPEQT
jgi:hypothetical protein